MTEFEKIVVDKLIKDDIIKFYIRYVDDTLVLAKEKDIVNIMKEFNSFDKNIKSTMDKFDDGIVHFLDIKINRCETDLYYKSTHTGQYSDFSNQTPWRLKKLWVKALHDRATNTLYTVKSFWKLYLCTSCLTLILEPILQICWLTFPLLFMTIGRSWTLIKLGSTLLYRTALYKTLET